MTEKKESKRNKNVNIDGGQSAQLLGLSLFVILLAFFIVLNGLSEFSKPKVDQAFNSIEVTFARAIVPSEFTQSSPEEVKEPEDGAGDAIDDLQGSLRSLLPNLDMEVTPDSNGGRYMAIRMRKDQFERLSRNLMPLFARILTEKDAGQTFSLSLTSYVRNPFDDDAATSFGVINGYARTLIKNGLAENRVSLQVEKGNPAWMMVGFQASAGAVP